MFEKNNDGVEKCYYPVGLLTEDELSFAGHGHHGYSDSSYLYTNRTSWSFSPGSFDGVYAFEFRWYARSWDVYVSHSLVIRPVVSLVPGTRN